MKSKKLTQGESNFSDSDLSPLERKITSDLKNIQEGKEAYKMVPVELWEEIKSRMNDFYYDVNMIKITLNKMYEVDKETIK